MTKAEVLKMAAGIVKSLIKLRTPDFSELEKAHKDLGEIVALSKGLDPGEVPQDVATGIKDVIDRMESFRSGYASNDPTQKTVNKSFTLAEFGEFVKSEVEAANKESVSAVALKRLHVLSRQIEKAGEQGGAVPTLNKAMSIEDTTTVTVPMFVDDAQIVPTDSTSSVAAAQSGAPAGDLGVTSASGGAAPAAGNAVNGSILSQSSGTPSAGNYEAAKSGGPGTALAAAAATVEAATVAKNGETFTGWPMDLNAPRRKSSVSFGRDPQRS